VSEEVRFLVLSAMNEGASKLKGASLTSDSPVSSLLMGITAFLTLFTLAGVEAGEVIGLKALPAALAALPASKLGDGL
jgi:hypothetical protein